MHALTLTPAKNSDVHTHTQQPFTHIPGIRGPPFAVLGAAAAAAAWALCASSAISDCTIAQGTHADAAPPTN